MNITSAAGRVAHDLPAQLPVIDLGTAPVSSLFNEGTAQLEALLPEYLGSRRWFAGKGREVEHARFNDIIAVPARGPGTEAAGHLSMIDVQYADAPAERYTAAFVAHPVDAIGDGSGLLAPMAYVRAGDGQFVLSDAMTDAPFVRGLVDAMRGARTLDGTAGAVTGEGGQALDDAMHAIDELTVEPLSLHSSNTSVKLTEPDGSATALKLVHLHDPVLKPGTPSTALDVWKGAFLTNETSFTNTPGVFGSLDHVGADGMPRTVSVLTEFAPNDGDGWTHALDEIGDVLASVRANDPGSVASGIERYARTARNHGARLGELHAALSSGGADSEFRGVAVTSEQVTARFASLRDEASRTLGLLRERAADTPGAAAIDIDALERATMQRIDELENATRNAAPVDLIHAHGDFHLGQLLRTGDDVQIIDLEGAPAKPIGERWQRELALGDVARQLSSYEYAAAQGMQALEAAGASGDTLARARGIADAWARTAGDSFVEGWRSATGGHGFVPASGDLPSALREAKLHNVLYEARYELNSRPDWAAIPLSRLEQLATDA